jgi:hypothetical protein
MMTSQSFFAEARKLTGALSQSQVDGFNILLDATSALNARHRAYVMATAWHETARTMQPIPERGSKAYFSKYDASTALGRRLGNSLPGDGYRFRGRGFVQITGRRNYNRASRVTGVDLLANPDLAMDSVIAAKIIVSGMTEGWFTGKKLADYADYLDMRRVVNGRDRAALIAGYAQHFEAALTKPALDGIEQQGEKTMFDEKLAASFEANWQESLAKQAPKAAKPENHDTMKAALTADQHAELAALPTIGGIQQTFCSAWPKIKGFLKFAVSIGGFFYPGIGPLVTALISTVDSQLVPLVCPTPEP